MEGEKWWSRKEVAGRWGMSVDSVGRLMDAGKLKALYFTIRSDKRARGYRTRRISESECQRYERDNLK
ncbi:MAG: hypothetical protein WAM89_14675 [Terriglobales bacterium]